MKISSERFAPSHLGKYGTIFYCLGLFRSDTNEKLCASIFQLYTKL